MDATLSAYDSGGGQRWLDAVLGFLYPEWCQICRAEPADAANGYVGWSCQGGPQGVRWVDAPYCRRCGMPYSGEIAVEFECANCRGAALGFDWARAAVVATPLVLDVVHRYKYNAAKWFEPFLSGLLAARAVSALAGAAGEAGWDYLVPVPLHPVKRRERGFNQAHRLALGLSQASGVPLNERLLRRVEYTQTQTMLNRDQRAENVRDAFCLRPGADVRGRRVVLVDDVLTTGSTTSACARVLRDEGALEVGVWTVARGV